MPEKTRKEGSLPRALTVSAGVLGVFLLLAALYVLYQAWQILFPQNVYETALAATVSETVSADGVLLFEESYVPGSGNLGYLVEDGERVSAGTAVAEVYTDGSQAVLRQQLTQLTEQIDLLQKSQNTTSLQLDNLLKERAAALYNMMDVLDAQDYAEVDYGIVPAGPERAGSAGYSHPDHCPADRLFCAGFQQRAAQRRCGGHSGTGCFSAQGISGF